MIILRADHQGNLKNSRPCAHCIETLQKFEIQKVIYSNDHGGLTEEIVSKMNKEEAFITLGWKRIKKIIPWSRKYI